MASKLQSELKQSRPFPNLETEVVLNVVRTHEVLRAPHDALMKEHALSGPTYNVLRILRGAGNTGLSCGDISERMVTRVPDVTRLLDRLLDRGLVQRERSEEDRRVVLSRITERGLDVLAELDEPITELQKSLLAHMSRGELEQFLRLMERVRESA